MTSLARTLALLCLAVAAAVVARTAAAGGASRHAAVCGSSQLRLAATFYGAAAGQFVETLTFTNAGRRPCSVSGWPSIEVEDAKGQHVSTAVRRVVQGSPTAPPYRVLVVAPGRAASFDLYGPDFDARSGRSCPWTGALGVVPPGARRPLHVNVRLPLCRLGFDVSPLVAGRSDHLAWTFAWHG